MLVLVFACGKPFISTRQNRRQAERCFLSAVSFRPCHDHNDGRDEGQIVRILERTADARAGDHVRGVLAGKQFDSIARQIDQKYLVLRRRRDKQPLPGVFLGLDFDILWAIKCRAAERAEQRYLDWASHAFRVSASGVADATQIHTHMCYSEFNDILPAIAAMDADVITIETSRSDMELLRGFGDFHYPNEIGPGVYDIHSPRIPDTGEMTRLLEKAAQVIAPENLWVNPDCGLKTRGWEETEAALINMVAAARAMRAKAR